jgi:tRNA (guanine-N7-)-methyltransferase
MIRPPVPAALASHLIRHDALATPIDWQALFGREAPVEVEVGCGKGLFLANAARANPGHDFFGIEMAYVYAKRSADRSIKLGLSNVKVACADARHVMTCQIPDSSIIRLHLYFPDPWWKKKHKKRRLFSSEFVEDAARVLIAGGEFHLATDVEEYFDLMRELVGRSNSFAGITAPQPTEAKHEHDYLTSFERKFRSEGRTIHRAAYRRV